MMQKRARDRAKTHLSRLEANAQTVLNDWLATSLFMSA